jgi:phage terminase large subunit
MQAALAQAKARIESEQRRAEHQFELRGNNLLIQTLTDAPEVLLVGPAGTGKTLGVLVLIDRLMRTYPGARALVVRKVRADLAQSVLVTYEQDVMGVDHPIVTGVKRESRQSYRYPNGSEIVVGGMDRPGRILSAQYDVIYPAEAVQFTDEDWETFTMRNRNYVIPFQMVIGDTNPDRPDHHLKQRADAGLVKLLPTFHQDNPAYWDAEANDWTPRGRDYVLGKLTRLSGVRKARYLEGKWVIAEGAVYEDFSDAVHVIDRFEIPSTWRRFRVVDFGYNNPFVCDWWAMDPDGRLYLYRQIYRTERIVEDHADDILRLTARFSTEAWKNELAGLKEPHMKLQRKLQLVGQGERIEVSVADHDAEDRETLRRHGIPTIPAKKEISVGIQLVQARLRPAGDGKPRIFYFRDALVERDEALAEAKKPTSTVGEYPGYVWPKGQDGKPLKEVPVDEDNHGMDTTRYMVAHIDLRQARSRRNPIYGG